MYKSLGLGICLLLASSFSYAKTYSLNFSICESKCKNCIEDIRVNFVVNPLAKTVTATGQKPNGDTHSEKLSDCAIQSSDDWSCSGLRGSIKTANGKLHYEPTKKTFTVDNKPLEICIR